VAAEACCDWRLSAWSGPFPLSGWRCSQVLVHRLAWPTGDLGMRATAKADWARRCGWHVVRMRLSEVMLSALGAKYGYDQWVRVARPAAGQGALGVAIGGP
jgi:hypothetical protein